MYQRPNQDNKKLIMVRCFSRLKSFDQATHFKCSLVKKKSIFINFLTFILSEVLVKRQVNRRQAATAYTLPDGAELIVGSISSTFSCDAQKYGYYADVANRCQIFHVCVPVEGAATQIFSFFCGNQTVFDQENLVCASVETALPCDQAASKYSVNDNFGKTDRPQAVVCLGLFCFVFVGWVAEDEVRLIFCNRKSNRSYVPMTQYPVLIDLKDNL
uniref:Chitin-binding type-2 domain-containing protein n=1 Tax=Strigamia maritima TaxID=126957 RepID=T1J0Q8_STRMM